MNLIPQTLPLFHSFWGLTLMHRPRYIFHTEKTILPLRASVLVLTPEMCRANPSNTGVHLQVWQQVIPLSITRNSQSHGCDIPSKQSQLPAPQQSQDFSGSSWDQGSLSTPAILMSKERKSRDCCSSAACIHCHTLVVSQVVKLHLKTLNYLSSDAHRHTFL